MNLLQTEIDPGFNTLVVRLRSQDKQFEQKVDRALDEAAAAVLNRLRTGFLQQVGPDGLPWTRSAAGLERESRGQGQTLFDTGRLFRSLQLSRGEKNERVIGTNVPYAGFHNAGTSRMPQREFLAFNQEHLELTQEIFLLRVVEGILT